MTQQQRSRANLSRFHPDYGLSVEDHEKRKVLRAQGKLKFVPKEKTRSAALEPRERSWFGGKRG